MAAAGEGRRLGRNRPKAFVRLGGRVLFQYSLDAFHRLPEVGHIVLVVPPGRVDGLLRRWAPSYPKLRAVVAGGRRRQDSVAAGLKALPPCGVVLIHDAARPFVSSALIRRVIAAARRRGACVPGVPVTDTIKRMAGGRVASTLDRASLVAIQTPQGFRRDLCERMCRIKKTATDDAALAERCGHAVWVVAGEEDNLKITSPGDLRKAELLARMWGIRRRRLA